MFCCFNISFHNHMNLFNQIVVTFRLRSILSSANQIDSANTPLYCRKVTFVKGSTTVNTVVFL